MEQRKLIKLGNSSFAIALPKGWVDKSGLKKGDSIFLEENSKGEINLWSTLKKFSDDKCTEIEMSNKDVPRLRKEIIAAYTNGSTTIHLKGRKERKEINEIKEFLGNLLGFEIVEINNEKIIAKDFFNIEETKINNFINRMDNNLREMFEVISESLEKGEISKKDVEEIEKIDRDTTKFYFLISRLFFKGLENPSLVNSIGEGNFKLFQEWWLTYNLEHLGDQLKSIAKMTYSSELDLQDSRSLSEILKKIYFAYNDSIKSFNKKDKSLAIETAARSKEVLLECDKLLQNKNSSTSKIAIMLKELENNAYQNLKMVMYSGE